jgi:RNA polymerase sigma factor (TIGR02999 family)
MADPQPGTVTQLLDAVDRGEAGAANKLWSILYGELRQMAHRKLAAEPHRGDRQTTSLVHDAFIRLTGGKCRFENRRHFFAAAARAMRQILVDDARRRLRLKRNEGHRPVSLQHDPLDGDRDPGDVLGIHEALERLSGVDPRKAQVVEYRYFAGLTGDQTAEALGVSPRTVDSEWEFARAWLHRELRKGDTTVH